MYGCVWKWGIPVRVCDIYIYTHTHGNFNGTRWHYFVSEDLKTNPSIVRNIEILLVVSTHLLSFAPIFFLAMLEPSSLPLRLGSWSVAPCYTISGTHLRRLGKGEADCKEPFVARCRSSPMVQLVILSGGYSMPLIGVPSFQLRGVLRFETLTWHHVPC